MTKQLPDPPALPLLPSETMIAEMSDAEVEAMFIALRWPDGVHCPRCGTPEPYRVQRKDRLWNWRCRNHPGCTHNFSPTSGTPFASRKVPLRLVLIFLSLVQRDTGETKIRRIALDRGVNYKVAYVLVGKAQEFLGGKIESASGFVGYQSGEQSRPRPMAPRKQIGVPEGQRRCAECGDVKPADAFALKCGIAKDWGLRVATCKGCVSARHAAATRKTWREKKEIDAGAVTHHSATELLSRPPKINGGGWWWCTGTWWTSQEKHDLTTLVRAGATPEKAAGILGRSPTSIAWYARDLLPQLPANWGALITSKRKLIVPAAPRLLVYPYLPAATRVGDSGADLIVAVNNAVPRYLPDHIRADIAQELLLAILSGELALVDLSSTAIRRARKAMRTTDFNNLSFEEMGDPDDERGFLATRLPAGIMERLEW